MSMAKLLEPFGGGLACDDASRNVFDIHGGGVDLVFPHHENEIAQSCCAFGSTRMANLWMHNGFLQVESEKMSKSLGNFVTIRELLATPIFGGRTWPGETLRLAMLRTHYRQPIDWTLKELHRAQEDLSDWYVVANRGTGLNGTVDPVVLDSISDDLNTHRAVVRLHELSRGGQSAALRASLDFLGFSCDPKKLAQQVFPRARGQSSASGTAAAVATADLRVTEAADRAQVAIDNDPADSAAMFVPNADGTFSADPVTERKIDELIARRKAARTARNWAESDRLRDELAALGVTIKDNKDGTTSWELKR